MNSFLLGNFTVLFCQSKKEREIIQRLAKSEADLLDFYDYPKTIAKYKKEEGKQ